MKSVNYPLRKIYYAALNGLTYNSVPVPVFYQKSPDDVSNPVYIVYGSINNSDVSSKQNPDTDTSIKLTIHSFETKYNDGRACDEVAQLVFDALYAAPGTVKDMTADGLQMVTTKLQSDFTTNYNIQGAREYVDRVLTFSHRIFHQ